MKNRISRAAILFGLFVVACSTHAVRERRPATDTSYIQQNDFYRSLIPLQDQAPIDAMKASDPSKDFCAKSDYAKFLVNGGPQADREKFILGKINRPFYVAPIEDGKGNSSLIGRTEDLLELACVHLVLNPRQTSRDFFEKAFALPNANFAVLSSLTNVWVPKGARDIEATRLLVSHPAMNVYLLMDILDSVFLERIDLPDKKMVLAAILQSKIYVDNRAFFAQTISDGLHRSLSSDPDFQDLLKFLVIEQNVPVAPDLVLSLIALHPRLSSDVQPLYEKLSQGMAHAQKIDFLLSTLKSSAGFSSADSEFRKLAAGGYDPALFSYAANYPESSKRLDPKTIDEILTQGITERNDLSTEDLSNLLSIAKNPETFEFQKRLWILNRVATQNNFDGSLAAKYLFSAYGLCTESPPDELTIAKSVNDVIPRYLSDSDVVLRYKAFATNLHDRPSRMNILDKVLRSYQFDDQVLLDTAIDALTGGPTDAGIVIDILQQKALSSQTLGQICTALANKRGHLSPTEKQLIPIVEKHPLATEAMKQQLDQALKGFESQSPRPKS